MGHVIAQCCRIKAGVVAEDERDTGLRRILNYGHTVGHAIEALDYEHLLHGEAVSLGMAAAADIACAMGLCSEDVPRRQNELLAAVGLPRTIADLPNGMNDLNPDDVIAAMLHDKKTVAGELRLVLPDCIGHVGIYRDADPQIIRRAILNLAAPPAPR